MVSAGCLGDERTGSNVHSQTQTLTLVKQDGNAKNNDINVQEKEGASRVRERGNCGWHITLMKQVKLLGFAAVQ